MLALVLALLFCFVVGAGVVGYVVVEARREGRGDFWTPEGEELIAGARRTGEKVRTRGGQLGRTAAGRTKDLASRLPERGAGAESRPGPAEADVDVEADDAREVDPAGTGGREGDFRAAS
ncbi:MULTISPECIES: hypothetical protein [unclassified Ornithinimicrobium]|uniref:hypothetical protein n=1 Tax=unclassified Ornithinimicrobium TaxID=2615080 RepID=UPI003853ED9F